MWLNNDIVMTPEYEVVKQEIIFRQLLTIPDVFNSLQ